MPKTQLKNLWLQVRRRLTDLKKLNFQALLKPLHFIVNFVTSWWRALIIVFAALIFLYYPLGGILINDLDNNTEYEIKTRPEQSAAAEMMAFLINREVNQKLWTPALPFFFPSAWLDNMPNYQLGIISSVANTAEFLAHIQEKTIVDGSESSPLSEAAELLQYPGTIWMFSPQSSLIPVPSASSQYAKARKLLIRYNKFLAAGTEIAYKSPEDLTFILKRISHDLSHSGIKKLEEQIREENTSWSDFKADNLFFYNQGKAYGYYLLLQALGHDYKDIIVNRNLYQNWTQILSALETASAIRPLIVRNAPLDSSFSPNHLNYLAFYLLKAQKTMLITADRLIVRPAPEKEQP